jgi:hypothetical protein
MEIIICIAVVVVLALLWSGYVKTKKTESDQTIDDWQPPKLEDKPWPYGEKLSEGKIHVKVADVVPTAPTGSENRVEAPAPGKSPDDRVEAPAPVVEPAPAKKAPVKKPAAKPAAAKTPAKKTPAKKSST